ncbi:hypothetical protein [Streptomyces erythrochromogenes]|uniref:hypothetical protein n=1 Tax=Streptomyces erythrochromogenes TaxID=285574 RepID=UPI002250F9CD|nr:hypothetical protein [Streptomyces erythrochromogenes]MCX5586036.1 hypothetical protein [Streptomyces erythrochromogenes]
MTTQPAHRFQWATYNTWGHDRRQARRASRKAWRDLAQLIQAVPAVLAAAHDRSKAMNDYYWSDENAEARQEARRRLISRCGNPAPRQRAAEPPAEPTEREELLAAGFAFSVREEDLAVARGEDWGRQRRAEQALASQQRIHDALRSSLRDAFVDPDTAA